MADGRGDRHLLDHPALPWLVGAAVLAWILSLLGPILPPFLAALLLAYLGEPTVRTLNRRGLPRHWAVGIVFFALLTTVLLILVVLIPLLIREIDTLIGSLPAGLARVRDWLAALQGRYGLELAGLDLSWLGEQVRQHWQQAGGLVLRLTQATLGSGLVLLGTLLTLVLLPVMTFYLLRDFDRLVAGIHALIPRRIEPTVTRLAREADEMLAAFLRGQLLVMLIQGLFLAAALSLVGLEQGILIGLLAGAVTFVPYLGLILGAGLAVVAMLLQTGNPLDLIGIGVVFLLGQLLEGMVLTPLLIGDRIGLHPVVVIFAVMAGAQLFGATGLFLALPAAAVLAVLIRHLHQRYVHSHTYLESPDDHAE